MTQQELADALSVSLRTVGNWERTGVVPRKHWGAVEAVFGAIDPTPAHTNESRRARLINDLEKFTAGDLAAALESQVLELERENAELKRENRQLESHVQTLDFLVEQLMDRRDAEEGREPGAKS